MRGVVDNQQSPRRRRSIKQLRKDCRDHGLVYDTTTKLCRQSRRRGRQQSPRRRRSVKQLRQECREQNLVYDVKLKKCRKSLRRKKKSRTRQASPRPSGMFDWNYEPSSSPVQDNYEEKEYSPTNWRYEERIEKSPEGGIIDWRYEQSSPVRSASPVQNNMMDWNYEELANQSQPAPIFLYYII